MQITQVTFQNDDEEPLVVEVICNGKKHKVIYKNGICEFPNHTPEELEDERNLVKLGAKPCGCLRVAAKFQKPGTEPDTYRSNAPSISTVAYIGTVVRLKQDGLSPEV